MRWPQIARLQHDLPLGRDIALLQDMAARDARVILALEGPQVLGSYVHAPADRFAPLLENAGFLDALADQGLTLTALSVATHIHVTPSQRGRGISMAMAAARARDALAQGRTHGVLYGYQTRAIETWAAGLPGLMPLPARDAAGKPITLLPLAGLRDASHTILPGPQRPPGNQAEQ